MYFDGSEIVETIKQFLPKYLSIPQTENLSKCIIDNFPNTTDPEIVYTKKEEEFFLQGDGIIDIPFNEFVLSEYKTFFCSGMIISNTCDISEGNQRVSEPNVQLAILLDFNEYLDELKEVGISNEKIQSFKSNLKENRISNLMYLPELIKNGEKVLPESIVRFDKVVSVPSTVINKNYTKSYCPIGDKLFTLSNYGFYLLLLKLSIHYCRFREGVFRDN